MSDGIPAAAGGAGLDGGDVPAGLALDGVPSAADAASSLPLLPPPLDTELTADDLEILDALPDDADDAAAAASADSSALPASPEPSQAPAAESSPLLLGQELSSEMSGASDPWLPTPSPNEEIGADAEANPAPAYGEGERGRDSLSTPSPSPHNDHSYTAPASPAETAEEGENVDAVGLNGNGESVSSKNAGGQENAVIEGENADLEGENIGGSDRENVGGDSNQEPLLNNSLQRHAGEGEAAASADAAVDCDATQPDVYDEAPPNAADGLAKGGELHLPASAEAIVAMEVDGDESGAIAAEPPGKAPDPDAAREPAGGALTSPSMSVSPSVAERRRLATRREADEKRLVIDEGGSGVSTRRSQARVGVSTRRSGGSDLRSSATAADGRSPASAAAAAQAELKKSGGDVQFACDQCDRSFDKPVNLRRHVSNAHNKLWLKGNPASQQAADGNEAGADGTGTRPVRCVCCSCRRSFRSLTELHLHRKSCGIVGGLMPSAGPTACSTCGRRCVSAIALLRHQQSHRSQSRAQRLAPTTPPQASSSRSSSQPRSANSGSKARAATATSAFECRRCGDSLPDIKSFIAHMETHSSEPAPYECSPTAERVGNASSASHLCDQCGRTFRSPDRLQRHMKRHEATEAAADGTDEDNGDESEGSEPRLCEKCGTEVSSAELARHMATVHGDDDVEDNEKADVSSAVCVVKVEAPDPLDGKQNGDGREGTSQPLLECPSCSIRFGTELELKRHMLKHPPPSRGGIGKEAAKLPPATTTGLRQSARQSRVKDHEKQPRDRQCRRCDRRFTHGCSLRRHELAEHAVWSAGGSLGALPTCHKCGRQFRFRERLRVHLASVHSRPSPSCSICGLRFASEARLSWHAERRHGEQRRFASRSSSSSMASGSASRRLQQRMYRCRHCVARFKHAQQLWLHSLRRHSSDIVRTGLGVVRGLEICGKAGKTLPLHRLTMWHSCLHCMARYRQLESLWRHTRLSHRDRLLDVDGMPLLPPRKPKSPQGGGKGIGNVGSPSATAAARGISSASKLPIVAVAAPVHAAFVSTAEQSKQLIARNFKIAPGGRESLAAQLKPHTATSHDPKPSGGGGNPTAADENRRYNRRDQPPPLQGAVQRPGGLRNENMTSNKPAPIGETLRKAQTADSSSRLAGTRATSAGNTVGSSAVADRRPAAVAVGGAVAATAPQQEQHETQFYSAAGRALRRSVLQRAAKTTDSERSPGTQVASSTAAHSGSDSTASSPGGGGSSSKVTLSSVAAAAASRRPLTSSVLSTLRQQAMCLWCEATFPRLAMLAEHACVHREDMQKIILESIGKRT